jgi:hypothetical protein
MVSEHPDNQQHEHALNQRYPYPPGTGQQEQPESPPVSEAKIIIEAILALGKMINDQVIIMATAIDQQGMMLNQLMDGLKGGRQVNEGRMSVMLGRIDVLEDTLRGKMELNQRELMAAVRVVENAAAQAACRAWDRDKRPIEQVTASNQPSAEIDYHDKPPGI